MSATAPVLGRGEGLEAAVKGTSLWKDAWRRLRHNKMAMIGLGVVVFMVLVAVLAPIISPYGYDTINLRQTFKGPSAAHWFGTDKLGRDLLTRVMWGARISLMVGVVSTVVSIIVGVSWGAIAGYVGGKVDNVMMRIVDILYGLPFMFFVILLMVFVGRSIVNIFIALGFIEWLTMARIVRGQVLSLKEKEFIEAARASGASPLRLIFRYLVPNSLGPLIVYATLTVPDVMLQESFLSFIGLGVQAPMTSWGALASDGSGGAAMQNYPWLILFPGLALSATLFSLNFFGDGLRDALDPQMRK
jgi:oligopeptide transport system permease protein